MSTATVRRFGLDIPISDEGAGQALLLLNGLAAGIGSWDPVRAHLGGYRTIAFDPPGSGSVSAPRVPVSVRRLASLAVHVLDRVAVERAHVVGYSFGGAVAQELARRHPDRVASLVLLCTTFAGCATTVDPRVGAALLNPWRFRNPVRYAQVAPRLLGGQLRADAAFREGYVASRVAAPPSAEGYLGQLLAAATWTSLPWLHSLHVPALVIAGDDDPIIPHRSVRLMAALLRDARLVVVAGGHLLPWERPAQVASLISDFVGGVAMSA